MNVFTAVAALNAASGALRENRSASRAVRCSAARTDANRGEAGCGWIRPWPSLPAKPLEAWRPRGDGSRHALEARAVPAMPSRSGAHALRFGATLFVLAALLAAFGARVHARC